MAPFNGIPTYEQQVALAIVPKVTSALSIFGSGFITFDALRPHKVRSSYQRLLVGMSICDLSMSGGIFMSTWPMPRDVPNVFGNVGNVRTCTAQGFFEQFGVSTVILNATNLLHLSDSGSLSIYYLITIRNGRFKSQQKLQKYELWLHIIPLVFGFGTAIASLALNLFNYGLWDCWIAPYPQGCEESWRNNGSTTCLRGDNASLYQWLFDLVPKWTSILIVTVNMVLVYIFVRNQEILSERWSSRTVGSRVVNRSSQNPPGNNSSANNNNVVNASPAVEISPNMNQSQERITGRITQRRSLSWRRQQQHQARRQVSFSRQIAQQSYLYVGALYITWLPVIVLRGIQLASGVTYYWLLLWVALSIPMHGFWNLLVYLRPRWLQKRREQMMKRLNAERRDSDAGEPLNGNGGGALAGEVVVRVATYVKELSAAAASALIEGDIPEALETNSNLNEVIEEEDEEAGTESVVKFASVLDVDSKDNAASYISDEEFEDYDDE
eukprot:scaffold10131_cov82-Skeletonema_dohrnii-CCMP3373.AAC.1